MRWSPEQIGGWLKHTYATETGMPLRAIRIELQRDGTHRSGVLAGGVGIIVRSLAARVAR